MRPTICFSLFAATAFASSAAAAAAKDGLMHLITYTPPGAAAGKDHKGEQIEIQSFHWGPRQSTSADGSRSRAGNQVIMDDTAGREKMQPGGGGGGGANESMTVGGGRTEGPIGKPIGNMAAEGNEESAQAAGKRQHKPITITKEWDARSAPLPQGSVRVKVKMPWLACRVGATYPRLELAGGGRRFVLQDVTVASCGGWTGPGDEGPEESITFVYGKLG